MLKADNLSGLANTATARTNLSVDSSAEVDTKVWVVTAALTLKADASAISNMDNTSDTDKPVSTAQQTEIDTKEDSIGAKGTAFNKNFWTGATDVMPWNTVIPADYVKLTTAQTVAWVKTFSSIPKNAGVATADDELVNKKYVDDNAWGGGWGWFRETIQIAGTQYENTILYEGAVGSATTLSNGFLTLLTAPTGASFIVGVSKSTDSGATYWTAENITLTATNNYVKGTLSWNYAEGDFLKIEVTQIGSTVAGQDLLFTVTGS